MSLWVVAGGQFGSEGKGKIAAHITLNEDISVCVRCGGPNSGHSLVSERGTVILRQLPTGYLNPRTRLLIPAGALIDLLVLKSELDALNVDTARIGIDRNAMVIEQRDKNNEAQLGLEARLSSTLCGVGSAVARRAMRGDDVVLAKDAANTTSWLRPLITDVASEVNMTLDEKKGVLVEGTQGFGLSLYHSLFYPKATSRDTTVAGFLSEVGLSPLLVAEIVLVFRTFPIRVAGEQAGPLNAEISWEEIQKESKYPETLGEWTSVSKRLRRVGRFDWDLARRAVQINRPTKLAINGLDYLDYNNKGVSSFEQLTESAREFVFNLERRLATPVQYLGTGPGMHELLEEIQVVQGHDGKERY